jgi:formate/nitrite transporter FocA (FNT family)
MNSFKFGTTLKYVLELFLVSVSTIMIIKLSFWGLNLASTLGNIAGGALFLATLVSYIYYIVGYVRRVNNHLND